MQPEFMIGSVIAALGVGNLLALLGIIFKAGKIVQRVEALEKNGNQRVPVAEINVKLDNLTKQVDTLSDNFDRQVDLLTSDMKELRRIVMQQLAGS